MQAPCEKSRAHLRRASCGNAQQSTRQNRRNCSCQLTLFSYLHELLRLFGNFYVTALCASFLDTKPNYYGASKVDAPHACSLLNLEGELRSAER